MATKIGILSDTHGLMRDEALRALEGSDLIIHAGDIGRPEVLDALARIAPVHAVRGNVDTAGWARQLPRTATVQVEGMRLYLLHNLAELDLDPAAGGFAAVIFGHSHKAVWEMRNCVLYLNPGSAGPRRFRLPVSVARMVVGAASARAEIVTLRGA
jgi:putative phosphoesterase